MVIFSYTKVLGLIISLLLLLNTNECFASSPNILLYLPFDGNCDPYNQNKYGIIKGSPNFYPGIVGKALLIGGNDNAMVDFPGESHIDPRQGTITFWVKPVDWDSSKEPDNQGFTFFDLFEALFYRNGKDNVSFCCKFPDHKVFRLYTVDLPLRQGQWAHIALSWLNNTLLIYANGELAGKFMLLEPMRKEWQGKMIRIGETFSKNHSLMDEFYIFDYPLSAFEIKQIYETSAKGKSAQLPDFKPSRVYVTHYPGMNKLFIRVDIKHAAFAEAAANVTLFAFDSKGRSISLGTIEEFDAVNRTAQKLFDLPADLPSGQVVVYGYIRTASGETLASIKSESFENQRFPWENKNIGHSDEVIPPFTPLNFGVNNHIISAWGREYWLKGDGFPQKILSREAQILANPITLDAIINGQKINIASNFELVSKNPGLIVFKSNFKHDIADLETNCQVEYDGMMKYTIKIIPNKEINLDKISLEIPINNENAKLYHVCRDAIRGNSESDYLPKGMGKIWGSSAKKSNSVLGSFIPYFWLGDYDRGLCWMADSDKNWSVPDSEDCVEFIRSEKALTAIINFIKKPKKISKPWEVTFALMAGPPRPEPAEWRLGSLSKRWSSWFCGNTPTLQGYGKPPDFQKYLKEVEQYKKSFGYWGVNTSPNDLWGVTEENKYFQLEWSGGVDTVQSGYPTVQRNDFVMYTIDQLMSKGYVDGLYCDDTYPVLSTNLITKAGYMRDDGKIQAGYSMFALRDFFKRSAYLFRKHQGNRSMMVHMTDAMVMPCYCFWDIKHDNEWDHKIKPGVIDHIDAWSLGEICAHSMSRQYGMAASWHSPADWENSPKTGGDDLACLLLLHDIVGRVATLDERTLRGNLLFGIGKPDVEFLGYWVLQSDKDPEKKDVKVSAWVRKSQGTALVVVANLGQTDWQGKIDLPLPILGLKQNAVAFDAEESYHPEIPFNKGEVSLSVSSHNYRFLFIGPKGKFPVNLPPPGSQLEKPKIIIKELSNDFNEKEPSKDWVLSCSKDSGGRILTYRNRLLVLGRDYKYSCAERNINLDNFSVQVKIERNDSYAYQEGLALIWDNKNLIVAGPNLHDKKFQFTCKTGKANEQKFGSPLSMDSPYNLMQMNWVKIELKPNKIYFYSSSDGKKWILDWERDRGADFKGAPAKIRLGKSPSGEEEQYNLSVSPVYFDDFIVGKSIN